jgi:hypothetical protein
MAKPETLTDGLTEARRGYFLEALRELNRRTPDGQFELTEIARQASRLDPDYDPRKKLERLATWLGLSGCPEAETIRDRERAYLSRRGEARRIVEELTSAGQIEEVQVAPTVLAVAGSDYGRNANENGRVYSLSAPVRETVG